MSDDWSREEVEIIVEDYLGMLLLELRGESYNKAERNRALQTLLAARSRGSIEFKHANISAVMIELGYPYVHGYKPRSNYQSLLIEIVERRVYGMPELAKAVAAVVERAASKPTGIADLLAIQVPPPIRTCKPADTLHEGSPRTRVAIRRNYLEMEVRNRSLGKAGEELVLEFEHDRLRRAGEKRLAERIEHVSDSKGDGLGFDILSFETDGRERLVEVKTTRFGEMTPFFTSKSEIEMSEERSVDYHVYRLFDFGKATRLFMLKGSMRSTCELEAFQFKAFPGNSRG